MHILIASRTIVPVIAYGGTERVIWDLGRALVDRGHRVTYLVEPGSTCDFAPVIFYNDQVDLRQQIPSDVDLAHFHYLPELDLDQDFGRPYLYTEHGNPESRPLLPLNAVFLSRNHASRHGATQFVHNGLDWRPYGEVDFDISRDCFHFLGKAAWRVKNVAGAIDVARRAGQRLSVLGGYRLNLKRGFRFTWSPSIRFHGMVGGELKCRLLNASRGLIFPVRWHEPFGLAVIESLYFGCPVYGTPYGSLPELVPSGLGILSARAADLAQAVQQWHTLDPRACHAHAVQNFSARVMAGNYLDKYEQVLAGQRLNTERPRMESGFKGLPWEA
ncbi:MAG: hypothetical protein RL522_2302 [Pseudomonadota bacterium]|jgi:glycosyltransferase involved in cell wall biosynthesis